MVQNSGLVLEHKSGVYKWTNRKNGKVYVGSAARGLLIRFREYQRDLPRGKCHNGHLQNAWLKYGSKSFVFSIIERCSPEDCLDREEWWIRRLQATNPNIGYNLCIRGRSALGIKRREETVAKLRARKLSPKHRETMIQCNKLRQWKSESLKKKSEAAKRLWANPEWRARQIAVRLGKVASKETRDKMSKSQSSRRRSESLTRS